LTYNINTVNPTCGEDNGSIGVQITSGNPPYSFVWSTGAVTQLITGLAAGSYSVTISDGNGCNTVANATLTAFPGLVDLANADTTWASCATCNDGAIDLTMGSGSYLFQWSNGATTEDLTNLLPGTYQVLIVNVNSGCQLDTSFVIDYSVGIPQLAALGWQLYPNPTHGLVVLEFGQAPTERLQIEVVDVLGQVVQSHVYPIGSLQQQQTLDLSAYPSAVYSIRLRTATRWSTQRVVLQKK
jgi:hypothetical protein